MVVYWEYAFAENFLLDGLIVYLALKIARGKVKAIRLILSAGIGAAEAIVFPLLHTPVWCSYLLKILGGVLICMIAVHKGRWKTYVITTSAFFLMTFALGGLLTAAYSFFDVEYIEGNGFYIERAPVALVLAAAGIFTVVSAQAVKYFYRYGKLQKKLAPCELSAGGRTVKWKGLYDSGNLLEFRGKPVCVFSAKAAFALFGRNLKEVGRLEIKTVNGAKETPVFECERLRIEGRVYENACLAVGEVDSKDYQLILHSSYLEGRNETVTHVEGVAEKSGGKRKRHSLPVRK